jgi:glycosyltransferase involved in cell wall biosynthesis
LPSLRISGGVSEALRFANDLKKCFPIVDVICLWRAKNASDNQGIPIRYLTNFSANLFWATPQLFVIFLNFLNYLLAVKSKSHIWVFTHYSTVPLALLVPRSKRWFFVQDLEWKFIKNNFLSYLLKIIILSVYRRSNIICANKYLDVELSILGVSPVGSAPIWADSFFYKDLDENVSREIDVLMILRKGAHKRLDLYVLAVKYFKLHYPHVHVVAISTDDDIVCDINDNVDACYIRPDRSIMKKLYSNSKVFLLLSEHEGFGLPPLESMGSGCVPVCRDSGGPRSYMTGGLRHCILSNDKSVSDICDTVFNLILDTSRLTSLSLEGQQIFRAGQSCIKRHRSNLCELFVTR